MTCNRRAKILRVNHERPTARPHGATGGQHDDLASHQIRFVRVGLPEPVQTSIGNVNYDGTKIIVTIECAACYPRIRLGGIIYGSVLNIEIEFASNIACLYVYFT